MRILITGGTSTLVGAGTLMDIQTFSSALVKCLQALGHEVDQRAVVPGENLDRYDACLVGMCPIYSMGARWAFGSLYVQGLLAERRVPGAILLNDWDVRTPWKEARFTLDRHWHDDNFISKLLLPRFNRSEFFTHIDWAWKAIEHLAVVNTWQAVMAPAFDWPGVDHSLCLAETNAKFEVEAYIDPTPWVETHATYSDGDPKERQWVSASLHPAAAWRDGLHLGWPVRELGVVSLQQERLTEKQVVQLYAGSWGLLSHPYYHAGSGFWRNRFNYGVANSCIVLAAPYEVGESRFDANPFCPHPGAVEAASDAELADIAYGQWAWLDEHAWSYDRMASEVQAALTVIQHGRVSSVPAGA